METAVKNPVHVEQQANGWWRFYIDTDVSFQARSKQQRLSKSTYFDPSDTVGSNIPGPIKQVLIKLITLPHVTGVYAQLVSPQGDRICVKAPGMTQGDSLFETISDIVAEL
jgi:hypothetical protein